MHLLLYLGHFDTLLIQFLYLYNYIISVKIVLDLLFKIVLNKVKFPTDFRSIYSVLLMQSRFSQVIPIQLCFDVGSAKMSGYIKNVRFAQVCNNALLKQPFRSVSND